MTHRAEEADRIEDAEMGIEDDGFDILRVAAQDVEGFAAVARDVGMDLEGAANDARRFEDGFVVIDDEEFAHEGWGGRGTFCFAEDGVAADGFHAHRRDGDGQICRGQIDGEFGAAFDFTCDADAAAVGFDDGADGGEAEPAAEAFGGDVGVEEAAYEFVGDAGAIIDDAEGDAAARRDWFFGAEGHGVFGRHAIGVDAEGDGARVLADGFRGIFHDVEEDLPELIEVDIDIGEVGGFREGNFDVGSDKLRGELADVFEDEFWVGALEVDFVFAGEGHDFAHHGRAAADAFANRFHGGLCAIVVGDFCRGRFGGTEDDGEDVVHVVGDARGEIGEGFVLGGVGAMFFCDEAHAAFDGIGRDITHEGEDKVVAHTREADFEMAARFFAWGGRGAGDVARGNVNVANLTRLGCFLDCAAEGVHAFVAVDGAERFFADNDAGHGRDVVELLGNGDEATVGVADEEAVWDGGEEGFMAGFDVGEGDGFGGDSFDKAVDRIGEDGEFIFAGPSDVRTIDREVGGREFFDVARHFGKWVQKEAVLNPENGQDEENAADGDEKCELPDGHTGRGRKDFRERDGEDRDGVAGDVAKDEDRFERV